MLMSVRLRQGGQERLDEDEDMPPDFLKDMGVCVSTTEVLPFSAADSSVAVRIEEREQHF